MIYLLDNKKIRLNPYNMRKDKCLGTGTTATAYLIDGKVFKLYNPFKEPEFLTKEKIELYKKIPTKRIMLAEASLLNKKRQLRGCVSEYVENLGKDNLSIQPKSKIIEELKILRKDFITLGKYDVIVHDAILKNTIYNNGAYLIDCGRYQTLAELEENLCSDPVSTNIDTFNEYLVNELLKFQGFNPNEYARFKEEISFYENEGVEALCFIEYDMSESETFGEYAKRKINM